MEGPFQSVCKLSYLAVHSTARRGDSRVADDSLLHFGLVCSFLFCFLVAVAFVDNTYGDVGGEGEGDKGSCG